MPLTALLSPAAILVDVQADHKKNLLQQLAKHLAAHLEQPEHAVFDVLWEREKLGTTGVGHGIAIPHGKLAGLTKVVGLFARLATPLDYEAIDEQPVDLVFVLMAPPDAGADHLKALAQVSAILRDQAICQKIRAATTADQLRQTLTTAVKAAA